MTERPKTWFGRTRTVRPFSPNLSQNNANYKAKKYQRKMGKSNGEKCNILHDMYDLQIQVKYFVVDCFTHHFLERKINFISKNVKFS